MVLTKVSDINVSNFSITKVNDNMYIRNGDEPVEIQSEWITLVKFPLPNLKFVKDIVASVPLSIPVDKDDNLYKFFSKNYLIFFLILMVIKNFMSIFKQKKINHL